MARDRNVTEKGTRGGALGGLLSQVVGSLASRGLGLVRLALFAPLLGPEAFGALRLAMNASAILSALGGLGFHTGYIRYLPEARTPETASLMFRRSLKMALIGSSVLGGMLILMPGVWSRFLFGTSRYLWLGILVGLSLPVAVAYKSAIGAAQGCGRFRESASGETLQNFVFLLVGSILILVFSRRAEAGFCGLLFGMVAGIAWLVPVLPLVRPADSDPSAVREAASLVRRSWRFSAWFAIIPLFQYLLDFIDRWMLARLVSLEQSGAYSIVPIIAGGMFFMGASLATVVARRGSWLMGRGQRETAHRLVWAGALLSSLASLGYVLIVRALEPLIWRLTGPQWATAAPALPVLLAYYGLYNSLYLIGSFAAFEEKPWINLIAGIVGTSVTAILNLLWIPHFGVVGAAAGTLSGLVSIILCHCVFLLVRGIPLPLRAAAVLALPLIALLPLLVAAPLFAAVLLLWRSTNLLSSDSERRVVLTWITRVQRRLAGLLR